MEYALDRMADQILHKKRSVNLKTQQQKQSKIKHRKAGEIIKSINELRQLQVIKYMCNWSPQRRGEVRRTTKKYLKK